MALSISVTHRNYTVGDELDIVLSGHGGRTVNIGIRRSDGALVHTGSWPQPLEEFPDTYTIFIQEAWLGSLTSASFTLEAETGGGAERDTLVISVRASEQMLSPVIGTLTLTPVQPENVPARWAEDYIASVTGARLTATVRVHASNTGDTRVVLSWPGGTYITRFYPGREFTVTLDTPPVTEDTSFTLTAADSNGRQTSAVKVLRGVLPYTPPTVTLRELGRCDAEGTLAEGGAYYRIRVEAGICTELEGNSLKKLTAAANGSPESPLESGVIAILGGSLSPNLAYTVTVVVQDQLSGEIRRSFRLAGRLRDFVLKRGQGGTHLGIGMTPALPPTNISTLQLPAGAKLLIGGEDVLGEIRALLEDVEETLDAVVTTGGGT